MLYVKQITWHGLDTNIALGFASCYISISAMRFVLYFMPSTHSNALIHMCSYYASQRSLLHICDIFVLVTWKR